MSNELQEDLAARTAGLDPDARRAVYERAREALQNDVRAAAPFMPVHVVVARRRELENAIMIVERDAARSDPPRPRKPREEAVFAPEPAPAHEQAAEALPEPTPSVFTTAIEPAVTPAPPVSAAATDAARLDVGTKEQAEAEDESPANGATAETEESAVTLRPYVSGPPPVPKTPARADEPAAAADESKNVAPYAPDAAGLAADETEAVETLDIGPLEAPRTRVLAVYLGVVALVLCAVALAAVLVGLAFESPQRSAAGEAMPPPQPVALPQSKSPAQKLLQSAGFTEAAQGSLERGNALLAQRDYARAIAAYDDALRLDRDNVEALRKRALANWTLNDVDAAIRDYGAAIERAPSDTTLRYDRAVAYDRVGEYAAAVADLDHVLAADPANADALDSRCWARAVLAHLDEALADCNKALKLRPNDADVLDSRGFVFLRLGRLDKAIEDYGAALKLQPRRAGALYGRGLARIGRGDRAGGQEDVAAARAIDAEIAAKFARYGIR